jgi:isocitrate/isopropylmalate dehydrogenase
LDHVGHSGGAERLRAAVRQVTLAGQTTVDLGGSLSTTQCGDAVLRALAALPNPAVGG